ncbi:sulfide/dihydroorotate dehydrogenase-like FAD/NAD-binding protein [Clostridium sp. A1-XYC3]|uniref:Sulfide/dihydroorotate dehydrogenase-like FAD/NAD-binding protein n=1 Tax=Clostridium tanneri TaxID=3037988 RepID=A0ABU4JSY6_9CLOT|nr:sulfide/dihydroorotate dehydrogenase-like FAD/NAD-binding protein [Clostridium sp. A1-XYC3]MDW8801272.1 sulfide/dihydroorotate dehydrogenase-like FAD/NAD-binding protein [Clostridium sp. A1-XYC3]
MDYEIKDCIDAGSAYCPCHLAETGDCILCSQLSGKNFCDCINWKGVCIYQDYILNNEKAKSGRKSYMCKIMKKEVYKDKLYIFTINAPHSLVQDLVHPGSIIFIRNPQTSTYYDTPISIMEADTSENILKVAIELRGVKTKSICKLKEDEKILIRGPFWNGILGLKNVYKAKEGVSIVVARGIGIAPAAPVLKKLYSNGNKVISIVDKTPFRNIFGKEYFQMCNSDILKCKMIENGELSEEFKNLIEQILKVENVNLIHCDGPDILIYKLLDFIGDRVNFSCCNNSKMCCGEGVCGTCSTRYKNRVVKKLCKVQVDPKHVFRERRLI